MQKREPRLIKEIILEAIRKGEILPSITKNVEHYGTNRILYNI
jgi:hypothetical protein